MNLKRRRDPKTGKYYWADAQTGEPYAGRVKIGGIVTLKQKRKY